MTPLTGYCGRGRREGGNIHYMWMRVVNPKRVGIKFKAQGLPEPLQAVDVRLGSQRPHHKNEWMKKRGGRRIAWAVILASVSLHYSTRTSSSQSIERLAIR